MNQEQEKGKEANMFTFASKLMADVEALIPKMEGKGALEIPDSKGQVLVRDGSLEYKEREDDVEILMAPVMSKGKDGQLTRFFICSR